MKERKVDSLVVERGETSVGMCTAWKDRRRAEQKREQRYRQKPNQREQ